MPTSPSLLQLADNYWLIAHDEYTGRGHVSQHAIGLGLAGCLLAELTVCTPMRISFRPNGTVIVLDRTPTADRVGATLLDHIVAEVDNPNGVHHIRDWLTFLSGVGYQWVTQRLLGKRVVEEIKVRQGLRKVTQFCVKDPNDAVMPAIHVAPRLRARTPLTAWDIAFARFAHITNLGARFDPEATEATWAYLQALQEGLPGPLQFVLAETEAAFGAAVLAHRI